MFPLLILAGVGLFFYEKNKATKAAQLATANTAPPETPMAAAIRKAKEQATAQTAASTAVMQDAIAKAQAAAKIEADKLAASAAAALHQNSGDDAGNVHFPGQTDPTLAPLANPELTPLGNALSLGIPSFPGALQNMKNPDMTDPPIPSLLPIVNPNTDENEVH